MISAKVIADSVNPEGDRLTTMELEYPRFIHGELMTHRVFSRNAASSRAIPTAKLIEQVRNNPAMPIEWGSNKPGMQSGPPLGDTWAECAEHNWRQAAQKAADAATALTVFNVHKQVVNRILEPFMWMKTIVSSTEWANFFIQRLTDEAQPEMYDLAAEMEVALYFSKPQELDYDQWHLPYVRDAEGIDMSVTTVVEARELSVARCARVSYLQHDGTRDSNKDLELYARLKDGGHWSPFEHVATPASARFEVAANFRGWTQLRHLPEYQ